MLILNSTCLHGSSIPAEVYYAGTGRPRVHGDKFKLNAPASWWQPDADIEVEDEKLGRLRLRLWHSSNSKFKTLGGVSCQGRGCIREHEINQMLPTGEQEILGEAEDA